MIRSPLVLASVAALAVSCAADTGTQRSGPPPAQTDASPPAERGEATTTVVVPESAGDRAIRRELNLAIARDPGLKDREISFFVSDGDINVTGIVRSESERRKINELAMSIAGVKSVANGLRIEE